jgi:ABC-type Fe3+/spermidine/putrescine transport system ATPase subunit
MVTLHIEENAMIHVKDLVKKFGEVIAVDNISFEVKEGDSLAIVGPSGSGKTTLLRLIAGLDLPDAGEIFINGTLMSQSGGAVPPHQRGIGFMFQTGALWPHMTVAQNILFGLHKLSGSAAAERLTELLEQTDLQGLEKRYPAELSGGQIRRVSLARTLAPKPKILLLDEPLTNVDPDLKLSLLHLVKESIAKESSTLLFVTHDHAEGSEIAEGNLMEMINGRLLEA